MDNKMILNSRNEKTISVWLECLIFFLVFFICEAIKAIITIIPIFVEVFKALEKEITTHGTIRFDMKTINKLTSSLTAKPSVMIPLLFSCIITIAGVLFYCKFFRKRSYASMGIVKKHAAAHYFIGMFWGIFLLSLIYFLMHISGHTGTIRYMGFDYLLIPFFLGFIIQSASEEILMRSYLMNSIAAKSNITAAVLLNSFIFMALHLLNTGVTILSSLNIFIFGIIFSLIFLITENIWMVSGMHFFWNFASGCILGSKVSGSETLSLFSIPFTGSDFYTGGKFGVEGSIFTTLIGVIFILLLLLCFKYRSKKTSSI